MNTAIVIFFVVFLSCCSAAKLPSSFKKCDRKQADFNDCLSNAILEAIRQLKEPKPDIGLPSLEPLVLPAISLGAGSKAVNFNQDYKNLKIAHLTEMSSVKATLDFAAKKMQMDLVIPQVTFDFDYEINGKVMMMPITGKGPGHISIGKPEMALFLTLEEHQKGGKKHFKVTNLEVRIQSIESLHVTYENLFNGDKALGDNINQVINDNWQDIFTDIKPSYEAAAGEVILGIANGLFNRVSIADLFGDA